jgi:DNA-binding NarL/FixJ family response regulator
MQATIHIGLVEDQLLFRQGMKAILSSWPELQVVFESSEGYTVCERLASASLRPDVMLLDLSLPPNGKEEFSGKQVTIELVKNFPEIKIIILSIANDESLIAQLIESGAHGYLVKDSDPDEVYEAITSVYHKGSYINALTLKAIQNKVGRKNLTRSSFILVEELTKREEEIIQMICLQLTTEQIADRLSISPKTVNGHRNNLLRKTGARNVAGLVLYAIRSGLFSV